MTVTSLAGLRLGRLTTSLSHGGSSESDGESESRVRSSLNSSCRAVSTVHGQQLATEMPRPACGLRPARRQAAAAAAAVTDSV